MFKKLTLLILIMFSLNNYAQVVIKDEIELDKEKFGMQEPESARSDSLWLQMPFYGKVREEVYWYSIACGNGRTDLIVDGSYYPIGPCYNMNCGEENCFCQGGYSYKEIPNVPLGTTVDTKFQRCWIWNGSGNPPSWGELEHYFNLLSVTATKWKYEVKARMTTNHPWQHAAYIYLTKTTPPDCPNADGDYCTDHGLRVPNVMAKPVNWMAGDLEKCEDYSGNIIRWAYTYLPDEWLEEFSVSACFDLSRQKWQFLTDNDNSIDFNTGINICSTNITYWLEMQLVDSLDGVDQSYPCEKLIQDLKRFKNYGEAKKGSYVFTKLLYQHELLHVQEFQENITHEKYLSYDDKYKELVDGFECEDFDDPEEAAEEIKDIIEDEWIEDLRNDAWDDDALILLQLLDLTEDQKWVLKWLEVQEHMKMYDIIDTWIAKAEECLN